MELTTDNYYSQDANVEYLSCSQYQDFIKCEARALAMVQGRWQEEEKEAFIVGNYFHTAMESPEAHEAFCKDHFDDIYKYSIDKKSGELVIKGKYAPYVMAEKMLAVCQKDPLIKSLIDLPGENEKIMTGKIFGYPWKIRLDKYIPSMRLIIDWKTAADLNKTEYNPATGERESFLESLGYLMRAAVYTEIERQYTGQTEDAQFVIAAVTKQDPPDKGAYLLNHRQRYDYELDEIKKRLYRIAGLKSGQFYPTRCGCCDYCRATKVLKKIVPYYVLTPKFREEREEEKDDARTAVDMEVSQAQA